MKVAAPHDLGAKLLRRPAALLASGAQIHTVRRLQPIWAPRFSSHLRRWGRLAPRSTQSDGFNRSGRQGSCLPAPSGARGAQITREKVDLPPPRAGRKHSFVRA
jgi:hypothetical protein